MQLHPPSGQVYLSDIPRALTKTRELLPKLYEYAKSHQLQLAGDPIEMCHIDDYETNDENEYIIELQIRLE